MTDPDVPLDLDAILARANAAQPGPWWPIVLNREGDDGAGALVMSEHVSITDGCVDGEVTPTDAAFIAAARSDVPALVARVRADAARIAATEAERDACHALVHETQGICLDLCKATLQASTHTDERTVTLTAERDAALARVAELEAHEVGGTAQRVRAEERERCVRWCEDISHEQLTADACRAVNRITAAIRSGREP